MLTKIKIALVSALVATTASAAMAQSMMGNGVPSTVYDCIGGAHAYGYAPSAPARTTFHHPKSWS